MARKQQTTATKTTVAKAAIPKPRRRRRHVAPTHDAIAVRAYELYLGQAEGDEVSHWLQAERELAAAS
jgi:DUF2934 family protein